MTNKHLLSIAEYCLNTAIKAGADAGDAIIFNSTQLSARQRMGKPETIESSESCGIGLRVLCGAQGGYKQAIVSSTDTSKNALTELIERAISMARISPPDPYLALATSEQFTHTPLNLDLFDTTPISPQTLQAWAAEAEEIALSTKGITNSDGAEASFDTSEVALVTSQGFAKNAMTSSFGLSLSVIAGTDTEMETDYAYSVSRHAHDMRSPTTIGHEAAERTLKRLHPKKERTGTIPVIFDPRVARSLLREFASAINGSTVARGTSFLSESLGKNIFHSSVNIIDNPLIKRGLSSELFDGEGIQGCERKLIDSGVLQTWLLDLRSGNQLNMPSTGHASRGLGSAPSPSSTNLYMQAGTLSPQELIADIQEGFYVTDAFGMGVNSVTGDYSQGASGFWIRRGEICYAVNEMTIAGNLKQMFLNMTPANDLEFRYGTNSPTLRIEGMTVAGS